MGLANKVYLWSEDSGVRYPQGDTGNHPSTYVTSLSFSSKEGGHSILAVGRNNGQISLWSVYDAENIRFTSQQSSPVTCLSFKPVTSSRSSEKFGSLTPVEELLVGDELGHIYYYSVEWMSQQQIDIHGWNGHMKLLARIEVHTQQICGLAWSPDGGLFASGANDNNCFLFDTQVISRECANGNEASVVVNNTLHSFWDKFPIANLLSRNSNATYTNLSQNLSTSIGPRYTITARLENPRTSRDPISQTSTVVTPGKNGSVLISPGHEKHRWVHSAAVKAIAFCPWQRGLIATGGGSNDRAIHFFHVYSGACLAVINVHAQVTSLIWSNTRREIAATFGYPQPDHPFRIAVFSWPECKQVVAVPWPSELRALYAIAYPGSSFSARTKARLAAGRRNSTVDGSDKSHGGWHDRTMEEGCIIVAGSDECVRFHEVWVGKKRCISGRPGALGGSGILEGMEGTECLGDQMIR